MGLLARIYGDMINCVKTFSQYKTVIFTVQFFFRDCKCYVIYIVICYLRVIGQNLRLFYDIFVLEVNEKALDRNSRKTKSV